MSRKIDPAKLAEAEAMARAERERIRGRILRVLNLAGPFRESELGLAISDIGAPGMPPYGREALAELAQAGAVRMYGETRSMDPTIELRRFEDPPDFAAVLFGLPASEEAIRHWLSAFRPSPIEQRKIWAWLAEIARTSAPSPRTAEQIERLSQALKWPQLQQQIAKSYRRMRAADYKPIPRLDPQSTQAIQLSRWRELAEMIEQRADERKPRLTPAIDRARVEAVLAWIDPKSAREDLSREEQEIVEDSAILRAASILAASVKGQRGARATEIRRRRAEASATARRRRAGRKVRPALRAALEEVAGLSLAEITARWPAANIEPPALVEVPCCPRSGCALVLAGARAAKAVAKLDRAAAEAERLQALSRELEARTAARREALRDQQRAIAESTPPTSAAVKRRDAWLARIEKAIGDLDACHPRKRRRAPKSGPIVIPSWPSLITPAGSVPVIATVISADQLVTSHLPRSWAIDPRYPEQTQERRYDRDPVEQQKVTRIARDLQPALLLARTPSALDGPPVVIAAEGDHYLALGGNGRGMALRIAYAEGMADAYEGALRQLVRRPLPPRPVLVRVLRPEDAQPGSLARWSRELNRPLGAGLDLTAQGVSLARSLPPSVISLLAGRDLAAALRGAPGREAIRELQIAGLVGAGERGLFEDEGLSEQGRSLVRRALAGAVLQDPDLVDALPASVVDQIARSAANILEATSIGGGGYDLRRAVQAAARDYTDAKAWRAGIESWIRSPHLVPPAVLGEALGPPVIRALVAGHLPELSAAWLDQARANPEGQATMFADPRSPPEILEALEQRTRRS